MCCGERVRRVVEKWFFLGFVCVCVCVEECGVNEGLVRGSRVLGLVG